MPDMPDLTWEYVLFDYLDESGYEQTVRGTVTSANRTDAEADVKQVLPEKFDDCEWKEGFAGNDFWLTLHGSPSGSVFITQIQAEK